MGHEIMCLSTAILPVRGRRMEVALFGSREDYPEVAALVNGYRRYASDAALVRVHSACLTGDVLDSQRCECGRQLDASLDMISRSPWGILIYLLRDEGRGIGLVTKVKAYRLQDEGHNTYSANLELHQPADERDYAAAISALKFLHVNRLWLITNSPAKARALRDSGLLVEGVQRMPSFASPFNTKYLAAKRALYRHSFIGDEDARADTGWDEDDVIASAQQEYLE